MERRKLQRVVAYVAYTLPRWLRMLPSSLLFRASNPIRSCWRFSGFAIYDITSHTRDSDAFLKFSVKALSLVKRIDLRKYQRIEKQIKIIINMHLLSLADYRSIDKSCNVDFRRYTERVDPELGVQAYACTLVHEATHGVFESRYIPYTNKTRSRIERICIKESLRLARKFEDRGFDWEQHFLAKLATVGG